MNNWIHSTWAATLGETLLHSLWEGAVAALVLSVVLYFARSARLRYGAACVAMLLMAVGMAITFAHLLPESPVIPRPAAPRFVSGTVPAVTTLARDAGSHNDLAENLRWLTPFWLLGVAAFYLRGIAGWLAARRLRTKGVCAAPAEWQDRLQNLTLRLQPRRAVALLESCLAEAPMVIGYARPVILMPVGLLTGLPLVQVEAILLHELAHIRRYDYLVNVLQVFVEGLLFYHPAVWWISRVIREERENCCDDLVVAVSGTAFEYATALAALEQKRGNEQLAMAATGGQMVRRIERLLGVRKSGASMPVWMAAALTLTVVTAAAVLQAQSVTKPLPAVAQSKTTAQAQPQQVPFVPRPADPEVRVPPPGDATMFDQATQDLAVGQYQAARDALNELLNRYPASAYGKRAKLAIADSWYRQGDTQGIDQAVVEYMDFIQFYPNTPEAGEAKSRLAAIQPLARLTPRETVYKKWANEDVAYIISDEERKAFRTLKTDEEQGQFVEQFWLRRDPTPGTERNEFKEEHYRRIAFSNNHFSASVPGWRTDRGRIYIQYGPPDEIEAHPATTTAPAYEQWLYKLIDGVGQNIIIEFVDRNATGDYYMTMDPNRRTANQSVVAR